MTGGPNLRYFRVEPPWRSVLVLLLLLSCLFSLSPGVHAKCDLRDPGTFIIFSIFLSSPFDGPSSGTERNLPVRYPTTGIQIVDYARMIVRQDSLCLECRVLCGARDEHHCRLQPLLRRLESKWR